MLLFNLEVVSDSFATPWTVAHQAPLSMEFSRQEYWSWQPLLYQGIFPTQGSNLGLLHCRQILKHRSHQGSPYLSIYLSTYILFQILQLGFQPKISFLELSAFQYYTSPLKYILPEEAF